MPIIVTEKFESRRLQTGKNAQLELVCNVIGTDSDREAKNAADIFTPPAWGSLSDPPLLFKQSIQLEYIGPFMWLATVRYDLTGTQPLSAEDSLEFDTSGGNQHITQSLVTLGSYAPTGKTAPDYNGAIGVTKDAIIGVDIEVGSFNFSETHHFAEISPAYKGALFQASKKVNTQPFRGFAAGEVRFLGASGKLRDMSSDTPWELTYRFAAQENATDIQIGNITGIVKGGWDYLWVSYADQDDAPSKSMIKVPVAVYVEQVYQTIDFAILGIGN